MQGITRLSNNDLWSEDGLVAMLFTLDCDRREDQNLPVPLGDELGGDVAFMQPLHHAQSFISNSIEAQLVFAEVLNAKYRDTSKTQPFGCFPAGMTRDNAVIRVDHNRLDL